LVATEEEVGDVEAERGGEDGGDAVAHSDVSIGYRPFDVPGSQDVILWWEEDRVDVASVSGVPALGLGDGDGAVMIERGARILKI
jgi:hypothetical protein